MNVKSTWIPTWIPTWHRMDHVLWSLGFFFLKLPLECRPNTKPGDHDNPNARNHWFIRFYHVWGLTWIEIHCNSIWLRTRSHMTHTTLEGPWPDSMILEVCWDGLWTLSFRLSQFHGHGSWLTWEVALKTDLQKIEHCTNAHGYSPLDLATRPRH